MDPEVDAIPAVRSGLTERRALLPELNHRTLGIFVLAFGIVGCAVEVAGPPPMIMSRLALFLGLVVAGGVYLARTAPRWRSSHRMARDTRRPGSRALSR